MRYLSLYAVLAMLAACGSGSDMPAAAAPPPGSVTIAEIQGRGSSSPLVGQTVSFAGIVTGDFQDGDNDEANDLGGFYVQQESPDSDPETSDAVFVFDGDAETTNVSAGDRVKVKGTVNEYYGETQVTPLSVTIVGQGSIEALPVTLPAGATLTNSDGELIADLERYEGMLLQFAQTLTVTGLRDVDEFGAVTVSQGGRLVQFTNAALPDAAGYASHRASNARRSFVLDDGKRSSNPTSIRYLRASADSNNSLRTGNTVTGLTGNLRYSRGSGGRGDENWRLMPTTEPQFVSANPRPGWPAVGGAVRIASFNVLNFFSTLDSGQSICGPERNENCRGADSSEEQERQLAKIVTALALIDADIVGLIELENNNSESLQMIVDALNQRRGTVGYEFLPTGTINDDAIKTGFIFKTATIRPTGPFALLDHSVDARFNDARNRPALAQTFEALANGAALTIVLNHLKSKGSDCEADGDPNLDDGQGNCNRTRSSATAAIASWLADDPTGSGDPDFLIIGDLNAYPREDPLVTLESAGFTNLLGRADNPYSFVFDSQAGALDHAVASASLVPQVVETIEWHINADEPAVLDYNLENNRDPSLFNADTPFRASDHDPVIIGLDLAD